MMTAKTMKKMDDIYVIKQLKEKGYSNSEIAELLNLPESTVRAYQAK